MAPGTRPPPPLLLPLLLLLLLPPPPATRALVPRISLPLGECGARAREGRGGGPRAPRADAAVTKEAKGGPLETWGSRGPLLL